MTTQTQRDEEAERAVPDLVLVEGANAEVSTRARASSALRGVTGRGRELGSHWMAQARRTASELGEGGLAHEQPASPAELRAYIHSAAWVPGEVPVLEWLGRVYGYLVALPFSLALYTLAWLLQRPGRALVTALITVIVWFTI